MPQLQDLLTQDQITAVMQSTEQLTELFSFLDPAKRQQVAAALPPQRSWLSFLNCEGWG